MILQALNEYYERKMAEPGSGIPTYGYGEQRISFCFVLSTDGELVQVVDLRDGQGAQAKPKLLNVPLLPSKRTVKEVSNFLWDNTGYVLAAGDAKKTEKDPQRFEKTFGEFVSLHREVARTVEDDGLAALVAFTANWSPERTTAISNWSEVQDSNLVFMLEGDTCYLHDRPKLQDAWVGRYAAAAGGDSGTCLVTGRGSAIAGLHPPIKGVGKQTSGASIVSFNLSAFTSFGKDQSYNSPISEGVAFAYTTALNYLLRKGSRQRIQLGDATTVFWADRETPAEDLLASLFDPPGEEPRAKKDGVPEDDPATTARIRELLRAAKSGRPLGEVDPAVDPEVRFHTLGLSPNNARLAVRFWNVSTLGQLVERVGRHFRDMEVERQFQNESEYPSLGRILLETARTRQKGSRIERDADDIPPLLGGAIIRSILVGSMYPRSLYTAILGRIRADGIVNYLRAAVIKAYLLRNHSLEVPMSLDPERIDPAYRLGRLFSLLEKVQRDAINPSATIRDRFFGSASATPAAVFPQLLRLGQHHISKAEFGGYTDKLIAEVLDGVAEFPKHLSLEEQGLFTLGYYHQRNALYRKTEKE